VTYRARDSLILLIYAHEGVDIMILKHVTPQMPSDNSFSDKVMGVFRSWAEIERFAVELDLLGISEMDVLEGESGEAYLDRVRNSVSGFLDYMLGDLETEMLHEYDAAIAAGHFVFAIPHAAEHGEEIVRRAQGCGAQHVAHFGTFVNTSY
jgi:hypothetical protein